MMQECKVSHIPHFHHTSCFSQETKGKQFKNPNLLTLSDMFGLDDEEEMNKDMKELLALSVIIETERAREKHLQNCLQDIQNSQNKINNPLNSTSTSSSPSPSSFISLDGGDEHYGDGNGDGEGDEKETMEGCVNFHTNSMKMFETDHVVLSATALSQSCSTDSCPSSYSSPLSCYFSSTISPSPSPSPSLDPQPSPTNNNMDLEDYDDLPPLDLPPSGSYTPIYEEPLSPVELFGVEPNWLNNATSPPAKLPHLIVCDWDDTLIPTTFLEKNPPPFHTQDDFFQWIRDSSDFRSTLKNFLSKLCEHGEVCIITNSDQGWVETSCNLFCPELWPIVGRLPIISARRLYEKDYPNNQYMWKYHAFREYLQPHHNHLLSFGDAKHDQEVTWDVGKMGRNLLVKFFKFKSAPTMEELTIQLKKAIKHFWDIFSLQVDTNVFVSVSSFSYSHPDGNNQSQSNSTLVTPSCNECLEQSPSSSPSSSMSGSTSPSTIETLSPSLSPPHTIPTPSDTKKFDHSLGCDSCALDCIGPSTDAFLPLRPITLDQVSSSLASIIEIK